MARFAHCMPKLPFLCRVQATFHAYSLGSLWVATTALCIFEVCKLDIGELSWAPALCVCVCVCVCVYLQFGDLILSFHDLFCLSGCIQGIEHTEADPETSHGVLDPKRKHQSSSRFDCVKHSMTTSLASWPTLAQLGLLSCVHCGGTFQGWEADPRGAPQTRLCLAQSAWNRLSQNSFLLGYFIPCVVSDRQCVSVSCSPSFANNIRAQDLLNIYAFITFFSLVISVSLGLSSSINT